MNKAKVLDAVKVARDKSKSRQFTQSVDYCINFKGLNFTKAINKINVDVTLPHATGKATGGKSLLFAKSKDFAEQVKDKFSRIIMEEDISKLNKKEIQAIADSFDVLLAEGPVMLTVVKYLGQALAPKGKMPKPVSPEVSMVETALTQISSTTKISNTKGKSMPVVHLSVGTEKMTDEQLAENIIVAYNAVEEKLPNKIQNVKSSYVKLTMGPPIKIGEVEK